MKFLISFIANSGLHTPHKNGSTEVFNLGYFRRILGNTWYDKVRNNDVLSRAGPCSHFLVNAVYAGWAMFTGWTMDASPKDLLYGELATTGERLSGRPRLRFKDICKPVA